MTVRWQPGTVVEWQADDKRKRGTVENLQLVRHTRCGELPVEHAVYVIGGEDRRCVAVAAKHVSVAPEREYTASKEENECPPLQQQLRPRFSAGCWGLSAVPACVGGRGRLGPDGDWDHRGAG
jgi:hypothetical protein